MKFRFINANEPVTTYYRDIIPHLVAEGHNIEILTSKAVYRADRGLDEEIGTLKGVKIKKTIAPFINNYNNSILMKGIVRLLYALHGFIIMLTTSKVDLNIFLTQPPFFYITGPILRFIRKQKYICVIMDVQPQQYIEFGLLRKNSIISNILLKLSSWSFQQADGIIVIGRCMAQVIESMGVKKDKIIFIPNWTSEEKYIPVSHQNNKLRIENNWQDKFIVSYGGNIGYAQIFENLLESAEQLKEKKDIIFVIIGGGSKAEELKKIASSKNLKNFFFLPYMHNKFSLSEIYGIGNLNFISLKESCTGLGVPSKAYVSLAAGRPIIYQGRADGEIARIINENKIGFVVKDTKEIVKTILEYYQSPERCLKEGFQARECSENIYSAKTAVNKYSETLANIL